MIKNYRQKGVIIIFTAILLGILVSISLALSAIFVPKVGLITEVKNSVGALYAAESGLEWCLYNNQVVSSGTLLGDANLNGAVTIGDSLTIQRHVDGITLLTGQALINADVNGDGQITGIDTKLVADYAAGIINMFPISISIPTLPVLSNGATYQLTPIDCSGQSLKSVGTFHGVTRAIQADFP